MRFLYVLYFKDDEDFEPQEFGGKQSDKWEGEDEDENDVKVDV